jgi:hypothetical protein
MVQVGEERERETPSLAKLKSCTSKAKALLCATRRIQDVAYKLEEVTGCELTYHGLRYPGSEALQMSHLALFCDDVTRQVAEMQVAKEDANMTAGTPAPPA